MSRRRRKTRSAQETPGPAPAPLAKRPKSGLSIGKKLLFSALATVLFFVALELVLAVSGWRPLVAEEDPYVGFASLVPLFVESTGADGQPQMVTANNKLRWFNAQRFPRRKPASTYRIFCLGGSTTYGRPYDDATSFPAWLRELLPEVDDSQRWEVINAGGISYASYRVANIMKELLQYDPDLFIVYTGHNEFLEDRTYGKVRETPVFILTLASLCSRTRTYAAVSRLVKRLTPNTAPAQPAAQPTDERQLLPGEVNTLLDSAIGPEVYHRDDQLRKEVFQHFEFNLRRMVELARSAGAKVVLVAPASNLANCSPFKSEHRADWNASQEQAWQAEVARAQERLKAGDSAAALQAVNQALDIDPRFAHALYLRGQIQASLGNVQQAKRDFLAAREEDVCSLRAPAEIIDSVRRVAGEMHVPLVDFAEQADRASPGGIPGDNLFLDHVHPTIEGNRDLAASILSTLQKLGVVRSASGAGQNAIAAATERVMSRVDTAKQGAALRNLSKVLSWAGKKEDADRLALQAIELIPNDAEAVFQAANALVRRGEIDEAIQRYERIFELNPDYSATVHASLGYAYSQKGDDAKAIEHYRAALRLNPEFADIHYNLAVIYESRRELDAAAEHFATAISGNPRHFGAHLRLGIVLASQQAWQEAQAQLEEALRLDPNSVEAHLNLGKILAHQGATAAAREQFRWILQRFPDDAAAREHLQGLQQ